MDDAEHERIWQNIIRKTWEQTATMRKAALVELHDTMMRERGSSYLTGRPRTAQDYISAIMCMRRADAVRVAHLAEAGPGHEQCPMMNFRPYCEWARARQESRNA